MKSLIYVISLSFTGMAFAKAPVKSLDVIWSDFYQKSLQQKSMTLEKEANDLSLERANRHWLPRAYLGGQWFSTNDPGQVFFNNIGQRSIQQSDFIPSTLNHPDRATYKAGVIGVDLPLYEGGMKVAQSSMYNSLVKASELELKAKKTEEYSELGRQYGNLLIHSKQEAYLKELKASLVKIISGYQVGAESNPVGYSGLLGLKGVSNRIDGMLYEFDLKIQNSRNWINKKTENTDEWEPDLSVKLQDYLISSFSQSTLSTYSSMILGQEYKVKTLTDMKEMEKARFLPKVGVFAQNQVYSGSRDTAQSQTFGLYVMWDIFNSDSYGRVGEANAKALAADAKLSAYKQEERIMLDQLNDSRITLEKNLEILDKSDGLLKEQTLNAMKLFRSGMLSALQLAEVINRRVDLIQNKNQAETQYLDVYSRLYQLKN